MLYKHSILDVCCIPRLFIVFAAVVLYAMANIPAFFEDLGKTARDVFSKGFGESRR